MEKRDLYRWAEAQTQITPTQKAMLFTMVGMADRLYEFFLLNSALQRRHNIGRRAVQKNVRALEQLDLIRLTGAWRKRNGTRSPMYRLCAPASAETAPQGRNLVHPTECTLWHPHKRRTENENDQGDLQGKQNRRSTLSADACALGNVPDYLLEDFLARYGPERLDYLQRCAWSPESRALTPATGVAASRLERDARAFLKTHGLTVISPTTRK